jgi:hypothetical protein
MGFILGMIAGAAAVIVFALHLSRTQSKPQATQRDNRIAAVGVDMNNNGGVTVDIPMDKVTLSKVFRDLEIGRG